MIAMDWNLFWAAFGAIGTTIGSLITAAAVIVSVAQYKQPFLKKISVKFNYTIANLNYDVKTYYQVTIINRGIRPCSIESLWIKGKNNNLYLNPAQVQGYGHIEFPFVLQQEETKSVFFEQDKFRSQLIEFYKSKKWIPTGRKLKIFVHDSAGDVYCGITNIVISKFLK